MLSAHPRRRCLRRDRGAMHSSTSRPSCRRSKRQPRSPIDSSKQEVHGPTDSPMARVHAIGRRAILTSCRASSENPPPGFRQPRPREQPVVSRCCLSCGREFLPRPQCRGQTYCSDLTCQKERRRRWQQAKRHSDPDYLANQLAAQQAWCARHPSYWRTYRERHPAYVERNRAQQRVRDDAKRQGEIAKMDAQKPSALPLGGLYELRPIGPGHLANMVVFTVRIEVISAA